MVKLINWTKCIVYIGLLVGAVIFSMYMDVFPLYAARETSIKVKQVPITNHPTVILCTYEDDDVFGRHIEDDHGIVQISYRAYIDYRELPQNHEISKIATMYNGRCVKVSVTDSVYIEDDGPFSSITLKFNQSYDINQLPNIEVYLTSESNWGGILNFSWRDGRVMRKDLGKKWIKYNVWFSLFPEQINKLQSKANCEEKSVFEKFGSKLIEMVNFQNCSNQCLPGSLRSAIIPYGNNYPLCQSKEEEECIFHATGNFNTLKHQPCSVYQYVDDYIDFGLPDRDPDVIGMYFEKHNQLMSIKIKYNSICKNSYFSTEKVKDNHTLKICWWFPSGHVKYSEEYLIFDSISLVMFVASILGLFIGFSLSGLIFYIIENISNQLKMLGYDWIKRAFGLENKQQEQKILKV